MRGLYNLSTLLQKAAQPGPRYEDENSANAATGLLVPVALL